MIKKAYVLFAVAAVTGIIVNASDVSFTRAFKTCSPYTDSGDFTTSGMNIKSQKRIVGFQGDRCVYKEDINMMGINSSITCKFTRPQINEIVSVMEAYELTQKYSGSKPDISDLDSAQNNPVSNVWSRYIQDGSVCTVTTSDMSGQ